MLQLFNEKILFENHKSGKLFRPIESNIAFINQGYIDIEINGETFFFTKGNILFISTTKIYKNVHLSKDVKIYILNYNKKELTKRISFDFLKYNAFQFINLQKNHYLLSITPIKFKHIWSALEQLNFYINQQSTFKEKIMLNIFSFLIYSIAEDLFENIHPNHSYSKRIDEITISFIRLVSEHFKEEKELKFYADKLSISIKYLSICVKEVIKIAPSVFIARSLINEAKLRLSNSTDTISSISNELTFSDQYSFGKFFKKHTGVSPSEYRKS